VLWTGQPRDGDRGRGGLGIEVVKADIDILRRLHADEAFITATS